MSFILDALKKSESDRLQKDAPGFSSVPDKTQEKSSRPWMWIVAVLVVINIGVLTLLFMRPEQVAVPSAGNGTSAATISPRPAVAAPRAADTSEAAPPATAPSKENVIRNPVRQQAATETPTADTSRMQTLEAPAEILPAPAPAAAQSPFPAPRQSRTTRPEPAFRPGEVTESLASFNDLRVQGVLNLPDLHLDIHVFSQEPADRFVFVNMSKYMENATLDEGPVVYEITPDGVILDYRGTLFLLPRE